MASEPQNLIQVENIEKKEASSKETKIRLAILLLLILQETSPLLKRLYESSYDLSTITDQLEAFKLLIIDALELMPQENRGQ